MSEPIPFVGWVEDEDDMNAYELADDVESWDTGANYSVSIKAAQMLRQQADKIKNMEIWEKKYLDRIEELEKDLALKIRDRDVFREFTLAYEKRIAELQEVNSGFADLIQSLREEVDKLRGNIK